ncbi:TIC20-V [Symbiodinium pilosum]|uniref:TIC20-V protein n=1 Tax=Symbiodinium pilosum TaxID=2952 RepID=A0A812VW60_SYMPI|nr:TIC20-V [Symbiodinium pilosum]
MENPHEVALIDVPFEERLDSSEPLLPALAARHWRDDKTLLFEIPWDVEDETGPAYEALFALLAEDVESRELAEEGVAPTRLRLAAAELLQQRIQDALDKNLANERQLSRKDLAGRKHGEFEARLHEAAIRLLQNERPLLEDELVFTEDQCSSLRSDLEESQL